MRYAIRLSGVCEAIALQMPPISINIEMKQYNLSSAEYGITPYYEMPLQDFKSGRTNVIGARSSTVTCTEVVVPEVTFVCGP